MAEMMIRCANALPVRTQKKGIKCPEPPEHYYEHLSDVPVKDYTPHESLEKLGKETLKELLVLLLQNVDNEGHDNIAPILIRFFCPDLQPAK